MSHVLLPISGTTFFFRDVKICIESFQPMIRERRENLSNKDEMEMCVGFLFHDAQVTHLFVFVFYFYYFRLAMGDNFSIQGNILPIQNLAELTWIIVVSPSQCRVILSQTTPRLDPLDFSFIEMTVA